MNVTVFCISDLNYYYARRLSYISSVKWPYSPRVLVAQWIEHLPGVWEVLGLIQLRGLRLFVCPMLMSCWSIHLSHFITELKIHHLYSLIMAVCSFTCKATQKKIKTLTEICLHGNPESVFHDTTIATFSQFSIKKFTLEQHGKISPAFWPAYRLFVWQERRRKGKKSMPRSLRILHDAPQNPCWCDAEWFMKNKFTYRGVDKKNM